MINKNRMSEGIQEFKNEMWDVFQTIKKHKWKILWAIAGLGMLWASANHYDEKQTAEVRKEVAGAIQRWEAPLTANEGTMKFRSDDQENTSDK